MIHIFHKYSVIKYQHMKGLLFGFTGCEVPALRVIEKCDTCGKVRKLSLNMGMPDKYNKNKYNYLWEDYSI